jgi:pimeloyl-ACP methyl ester carboxylesterase
MLQTDFEKVFSPANLQEVCMPFWNEIYYHLYQSSRLHTRQPLVLIHGAAGNHLYWPHELRRLPGEDVFALDLPAHGKSQGQARQTISAYANVVHDWLLGLEISEAIFVGHSMGGAIALNLALDHPDCVAGLVLVGTGARLRVLPEILQYAESETTYLNAVRLIVNSSFSDGASTRMVELASDRMAEVRHSVLYADLRACDQFDVADRLSMIDKATLILCGEYDLLTPLRYSHYLAEQILASQLRVIPGTGHMLQLENPRQVAEAIKEYLLGLRR